MKKPTFFHPRYDVPDSWQRYFEKEEYQEYLRLKAKYESNSGFTGLNEAL